MTAYGTGNTRDPDMKTIDIDALGGTAFQRDVWRALTRIPRGKTVTYAELARMCGHAGAVRAVANAVGRNPMPPVIPCHRVIRSDGAIGGYSGPGGVDEKRRLLAAEGVIFLHHPTKTPKRG